MNDFQKKSVTLGILTVSCGIIANFIPAVYFFLAYGEMPPVGDLVKLWTVAAVTFGVSWFIQPTTFFPMMGLSGNYIGWVTGNCADIRCPAITMAQKAAGYEAGTEEGDVISTLGICVSSYVSLAIITFFAIVGGQMINNLPPFLKAGFKYILPAVFGAVYLQLCLKHLKVGACTIAFAFLCFFVMKGMLHLPNWILNIIIIASGIVFARIFFLASKKS